MKKVLLFGGSFDPIHDGHLEVAKNALKHTSYHEVWFLVAALNPFKDKGAGFDHRVKMVELMISPFSKFKVCTVESELSIPSYSIDTVRELIKRYPNFEFGFLIGSDQIDNLHKWKEFNVLNSMVDFYVYERRGYETAHPYETIPGTKIDVSSTEIREGQSNATSKHVLRYMMYEGLYLDEILKHQMSVKRYQHSLMVTELAVELAKTHNVDKKQVRLIAMTHDLCKEWDEKKLELIVKMIDERLLEYPKAFYHAFVASYWLNHYYGIYDKKILSPIWNHVSGNSYSKLSMILYIADKCERSRPYDSEWLIQISKDNLYEGFKKVKEESEKYVKERL